MARIDFEIQNSATEQTPFSVPHSSRFHVRAPPRSVAKVRAGFTLVDALQSVHVVNRYI